MKGIGILRGIPIRIPNHQPKPLAEFQLEDLITDPPEAKIRADLVSTVVPRPIFVSCKASTT